MRSARWSAMASRRPRSRGNCRRPQRRGELLHVGGSGPLIQSVSDGATVPVALRTGDVVSTILKAADEQKADLVAMPTSGHQGFLDAVRGSTTERVLRHAPCPVLAVPAGRPQADQRRAAGTDHRVAQALEILGLEAGATNEEIRAAYIHLMQRVHPDKGGTDFFAKQLIDAREVLLGQRARYVEPILNWSGTIRTPGQNP
jgi:Universal stress protein family/DnaJ domain